MRMQRLNMDNSWHITLGGVRLLVDPWLEGVEVDYSRWLNVQWHRTAPLPYERIPDHDLVLITQKYPDHCHAPTLARLRPAVVCAPASLGGRLGRILPDSDLLLFDEDHPEQRVGHLRLIHLPTRRRIDPIYDAYALAVGEEVILVANHGIELDAGHRERLGSIGRVDVLMSPFNRYVLPSLLGGVVAPGLEGLEALIAATGPRVVVQTHDELKHGTGLVPRLARIEPFMPETAARHPWLQSRFRDISDYTPVRP